MITHLALAEFERESRQMRPVREHFLSQTLPEAKEAVLHRWAFR